MRLHNRIIKAAFWTDTDLLRYLDRDGRMFYIGLIQLADDSGCLEDDLLAFKIHLYPADMDVDLDFIQKHRDRLVELGKLIPYTSEGKQCLYLKNFHKHQSLRSPAPPSVPLPEWITWEPGETARSSGKYIVSEPYGDRTVTVSSPYGDQPEPEPELEPEPEEKEKVNICAPDGARAHTAPGPGGSVEAEKVTATPEDKPSKSGPRSPFKSKRQEQLFDEFWAQYPRKRSKGQAEKTWVKLCPDDTLFADIMHGLARAKGSKDWQKDEGQFIPYPSTWLNAKGWEDEYESVRVGPQLSSNVRKGMELVAKYSQAEGDVVYDSG
jgi:hypothetical protein